MLFINIWKNFVIFSTNSVHYFVLFCCYEYLSNMQTDQDCSDKEKMWKILPYLCFSYSRKSRDWSRHQFFQSRIPRLKNNPECISTSLEMNFVSKGPQPHLAKYSSNLWHWRSPLIGHKFKALFSGEALFFVSHDWFIVSSRALSRCLLLDISRLQPICKYRFFSRPSRGPFV